jgi:hypothetical protein
VIKIHHYRNTRRLDLARDEHVLDFGDCFCWVQAFRASLGAIQDRVATIEAERVLDIVEPLARCLVTRIDEPAIGLQQHGGAEIAIAVPPIARAGCRAAGTKDAFVKPVEFSAVPWRLKPFFFRRRRGCLQPGLDRGVLRVKHREVRHKIFNDWQMRQGIDFDRALDVVHGLGAGERVRPVDIHRARPANAFPARAPEGERRIDLRFYPNQTIENHWPAIVAIDEISVHARILIIVRVPAINPEFRLIWGLALPRPGLTGLDAGVGGE